MGRFRTGVGAAVFFGMFAPCADALAAGAIVGDRVRVHATRTTDEGTLVEYVPGDHVTIVRADGYRVRFEGWEVERVERWTEPPRRFRVEAMLGFTFFPSSEDSGNESTLLSGIGMRIGYTVWSRLYLGALYVVHPGFLRSRVVPRCTSQVCSPNAPTRVGSESNSVPYVGGEIGYEASSAIRLYLGGGAMLHHGYSDFDTPKNWTGKPGALVWPGIALTLSIGDHAFVGVDTRYVIVAWNFYAASGLSAFATWGVRF